MFGTCFVTFSCFDYDDFAKNYNIQGIYHFGINDKSEIGYNTLLISPKGLDWAKNFTKIVFLSPVIDEGYITALSKHTTAEIYIPIDKNNDSRKFSGLDLSRETYGKIYKSLSSVSGRQIYNEFDLYDKLNLAPEISFSSFYFALKVFNELELIKIEESQQIVVYTNKTKKNPLENSKLYNMIIQLKEASKRRN